MGYGCGAICDEFAVKMPNGGDPLGRKNAPTKSFRSFTADAIASVDESVVKAPAGMEGVFCAVPPHADKMRPATMTDVKKPTLTRRLYKVT